MVSKVADSTVQKCKQALAKQYGKRFWGLILYRSVAREQEDESSDIDLLVWLSPPFDYITELRQIVEVLYPVQLESERLISAKPALESDFQAGSLSPYRNAAREGVTV